MKQELIVAPVLFLLRTSWDPDAGSCSILHAERTTAAIVATQGFFEVLATIPRGANESPNNR
ncbi:hypothetical protein J8I87_11795 [Paraburkholderia sp. LEh10]|uniref:hypothetical protein n=1 Tax=Paraburkholderia sp. LEh10 TaxID=2821353 RepID=UPI001AE5F8EE|nr:hypothetical protein [Paraburkholderia sp. LEh10]MBP0590383.1 hypothetical protein [Paraburkholderia sp. LEh10]